MEITFLPLVEWNTRWLLSGDQVSCKACKRHQLVTDLHAFDHALSCTADNHEPQYPGRELALVLQQKITAGLY